MTILRTDHKEDRWIFYTDEGKKVFGRNETTEEQAIEIIMNPPQPEVPGIQPPNLQFELGVTEQDRQLFTADLTGFQVKLLRGTANLGTPVKITDKNGVLREITIGEYLEALDYYHSALRALWEAQL